MRLAPVEMSTKIAAVDGGGGAGKTRIAELLSVALGGAQIIHTDDFASWDNPLDWWPRLIKEVLKPISRNEVTRFQATRWLADQPLRTIDVKPADSLVLEGVSASREVFQPYLTYSIWVDTPAELPCDAASNATARKHASSGFNGWPRRTPIGGANGPTCEPTS